jgi:hypothetical protein
MDQHAGNPDPRRSVQPHEQVAHEHANTHQAVNVLMTPREALVGRVYGAVLSSLAARHEEGSYSVEDPRVLQRRLGSFGPNDETFVNQRAYRNELRSVGSEDDRFELEETHVLVGTLHNSVRQMAVPRSLPAEAAVVTDRIGDVLERFELDESGAKDFVTRVSPQLQRGAVLTQVLVPRAKLAEHVFVPKDAADASDVRLLLSDAGVLNPRSGFKINTYHVSADGRTTSFVPEPAVEREIRAYVDGLVPPNNLALARSAITAHNDDRAMGLHGERELPPPATVTPWNGREPFRGPALPLGEGHPGRYAVQVSGADYRVLGEEQLHAAGQVIGQRDDGTFWPHEPGRAPFSEPSLQRADRVSDYAMVENGVRTHNRTNRANPLPMPSERAQVSRWDGRAHDGTEILLSYGFTAVHTGRGNYQVVEPKRREEFRAVQDEARAATPRPYARGGR